MTLYTDGIVDPLAAAGGRELSFIPKHFHCVPIGSHAYYLSKEIRHWIWKNQIGRFALVTRTKLEEYQGSGGRPMTRLATEYVAAFEDQGEAIMFSFIVPTLQGDFDDFI